MANNLDEISQKRFAPEAESLAKKVVFSFAQSLFYHARALAHKRGEEMVLTTHVNEALSLMYRERSKKPWKEAAIALGSALFGTAVALFVTEGLDLWSNPPVYNAFALIGSFVGVVVSLLITVAGLWRE